MRRKEVETLLDQILNSIEVVEYTGQGEEGNVYLDEMVKRILVEYNKKAGPEKMKELSDFLQTIIKSD